MSKLPLVAEPSLPNKKQADFGIGISEVPYSKADVLRNERDIVTHVISVYDDPSLNPWTFRSFFIGFGLSAFGGVLGKRHSCSKGLHQLTNSNK